ncbi:MAG: DUF421 domain-containing protein [Clostridia bacterium]|nr:DUF421 domain-containing protein [Clostridia bacterium]MBQ4157674.1 DUF421 domain-containing protein [Clostridia bacterium]
MFTILIRAFLLYVLMILFIRALGKRQLGQFQPYELAMALIIAELLATPMANVSTPLLHGLIPVLAVLAIHGIIALICLKSDKARALISGKPSVLIAKGVINDKELTRLCLTLSDLLEGVRESGILNPGEVECAIMEANGKITAFPRSAYRSPNVEEMGIDAGYEGVPLALIMDGRVQENNLTVAHLTKEWLRGILSEYSLSEKAVYLAVISTKGVLSVQEKSGNTHTIQAVNPEEVKW